MSQGFCIHFYFFGWFSGLLVWYKGKKWPKMKKNLSVALHISATINYMIIIFGAHVQNNISRKAFFSLFQNFNFPGCQGVKWPKMAKIFLNCTFCLRKHTSYDLHLHICKKVISLGFLFLFLQSFNFLGCWMTQKCHTSYLRKHASHDCNFWYTFVKWLQFFHVHFFFSAFFIFSKFWFFSLLGA